MPRYRPPRPDGKLRSIRILLVSAMYPGPADPDLGVFVRELELALRARGHELALAVVNRRSGGKRRWVELAARAATAARRFRPDVVYAHFLVPTGLLAGAASRAPLVVTAHGQDVANIGRVPGIRAATGRVARRAAGIVAVSDYLRRRLEELVPEARGRVEVVDCGVNVERFSVLPAPAGPPAFLCIGSLSERKNVLRLAGAFERLEAGTLTFVGDGPLRPRLEGRSRMEIAGVVPHEALVGRIARARVVCQPSLVEPLGQAVLEGLACGRPVVATRVGGPPEFVTPEAGVLVDPTDEAAIAEALARAAALPCPNEAARAIALEHDVRLQAERVEQILLRAAEARRRTFVRATRTARDAAGRDRRA
jgi:glycosyltransferase involved in cell wall biosynthesis